jgi:hypothetical protein
MADGSADTSPSGDAATHEQELVLDLEDLEAPVSFDVKPGKNRIVIRFQPAPFRFSV